MTAPSGKPPAAGGIKLLVRRPPVPPADGVKRLSLDEAPRKAAAPPPKGPSELYAELLEGAGGDVAAAAAKLRELLAAGSRDAAALGGFALREGVAALHAHGAPACLLPAVACCGLAAVCQGRLPCSCCAARRRLATAASALQPPCRPPPRRPLLRPPPTGAPCRHAGCPGAVGGRGCAARGAGGGAGGICGGGPRGRPPLRALPAAPAAPRAGLPRRQGAPGREGGGRGREAMGPSL